MATMLMCALAGVVGAIMGVRDWRVRLVGSWHRDKLLVGAAVAGLLAGLATNVAFGTQVTPLWLALASLSNAAAIGYAVRSVLGQARRA